MARSDGLAFGIVILAFLMLPTGSADATDWSLKDVPVTRGMSACGTTGGFVLPDSETCLRIGAGVRVDYETGFKTSSFTVDQRPSQITARTPTMRSRSTLQTSAILSADARTQTELGPLRVYVSIRGRAGTSAPFAGPTSSGR